MDYKIEIIHDEFPVNPRNEGDNLGTMVCFHRRYSLGNRHYYDAGDYSSWDEMRNAIIKNENPAVILPLYLLDHSGISISTSQFGCPWDSGQIGFIYVGADKVRREYNVKRLTQEIKRQVAECLKSEVKVYDAYLTGDTWGYRIVKEDEIVEQVFGFYGRSEVESIARTSLHYIKEDLITQ